ncbi:MAG: DNA-directed RNA polymerase subunit K [Candidatus Aenigmarchaeota archaeon]|nr:DNA-directed RNA polymerase subunit K [Candidatus Aenigmarchaeota archaeon]
MTESKREYSKFERTRIISARALQIAQGSPVFVDVPKGEFRPIEIAKMEWDVGLIPIDIKGKE